MPLSHKTHPLITGTLLLTAAGLFSRVLGFFYRIFLSRTIGAEGLGIYQMIFPVYGIFFSSAPGRSRPLGFLLYRGGPGPCEADTALWLFFILCHVSGRRLCDPALLGPSCGTCPHGTAVCPAAFRHGLRDSVYLCPCLHMRVLLRKRKSLRPRCRPAF